MGGGGEQQGEGTQENCSATCLTVSGFIGMELVSGLSLTTHLSWPVLGLTQGPSWWPAHLPAKMHSSAKDPGEVGCLLPPVGLSLILLVSLQGSTVFCIRDSCHESAHVSSYYCAWTRWAVLVNGPLTILQTLG